MKTKQKFFSLESNAEIAQHKFSLLTMTIHNRHYARSTEQQRWSSQCWSEAFTRGSRAASKMISCRVWSFNSIAKKFFEFHLRMFTGNVVKNETITQHENIGSAHNPMPKTSRSGSEETHAGIFSRTDFNRFEMNVWCLWGAKKETRCENWTRNFNSVEFLVDVGRWFSSLSCSRTDFIKTEIICFKVNIEKGLIGPRLIEFKTRWS